jgi:hypothetical protein
MQSYLNNNNNNGVRANGVGTNIISPAHHINKLPWYGKMCIVLALYIVLVFFFSGCVYGRLKKITEHKEANKDISFGKIIVYFLGFSAIFTFMFVIIFEMHVNGLINIDIFVFCIILAVILMMYQARSFKYLGDEKTVGKVPIFAIIMTVIIGVLMIVIKYLEFFGKNANSADIFFKILLVLSLIIGFVLNMLAF